MRAITSDHKLIPFQHAEEFIPYAYYIFNASNRCWLAPKDRWTENFKEALICPTYEHACLMFDGPLPDGFTYLSCEIFATQHVWYGPPD
jgi:hypothetical protein